MNKIGQAKELVGGIEKTRVMVYGFVDFSKCLDGSDGRPRNLILDDDKFDKTASRKPPTILCGRPTSFRLTDAGCRSYSEQRCTLPVLL